MGKGALPPVPEDDSCGREGTKKKSQDSKREEYKCLGAWGGLYPLTKLMARNDDVSHEAHINQMSNTQRMGIMLENLKPCSWKNAWLSALILSVSRVMRLKPFRLA